jgi:hypothetical protein
LDDDREVGAFAFEVRLIVKAMYQIH